MAQPLSAATTGEQRHDIIQLCLQLEFFQDHPPVQSRALTAGQSHQTFYVATARGEYVLRRYLSSWGVCRQQEFRCQQAAAAVGLAPAPLLLHNHQQILLSEFVPAAQSFKVTSDSLPLLAKALARFHSLPLHTPVLSVKPYLQQLVTPIQLPLLEPAAAVLAELMVCASALDQITGDQVLCHFDLHADNILWAEQRLWLLDFEYAQLADNSFDLAAIILNFELNAAQEQQLLILYQQGRHYADPEQAQQSAQTLLQRLHWAKCLYSGFCWLWYLAMPQQQVMAQQWLQRLKQLLALKPA